jgi:hypothetical protein
MDFKVNPSLLGFSTALATWILKPICEVSVENSVIGLFFSENSSSSKIYFKAIKGYKLDG